MLTTYFHQHPYELLQRPAVRPPLVDDTLPLRDYFISRSVPFSDVCEAIGAAVGGTEDGRCVDTESGNDWPVFVSLECHVPAAGQDKIVEIMKNAWGDKLVTKEDAANLPPGHLISPRDLKGRIVLMVEYYPINVGSNDAEQTCEAPILPDDDCIPYEANPVIAAPREHPKIAESLAELGFFARSMKPPKGWEYAEFPSPPYPPNLMFNVDESSMLSLMPLKLPELVQSAKRYLRRVYPSGLRLDSSNLHPLREWRCGTQLACLNWQHYDGGMQLNEGLFAGTMGRNRWLPLLKGRDSFSGYISVQLLHTASKQEWRTPKVKCSGDKVFADLTWEGASFEWNFGADELAFLRLVSEAAFFPIICSVHGSVNWNKAGG
ncbi:hypothetical protein ID866_7132 [Astraeus odoratus]|nr:hypothetical protein ID866_7132 [Astraeus odoratus]